MIIRIRLPVIRINTMERDTFDPHDNLGSYTRTFCCPAERWSGQYQPAMK
jgi:hypothetical protein